jgi:hypothetical protein
MFSEAESAAHMLLALLVDLNPTVAATVLPERMPLAKVLDALPKIMGARIAEGHAIHAALADVVRRFTVIAQVRNDVLHNGTTLTEGGAALVKSLHGRRKGDHEPTPLYPLSVEVFDSMTYDCSQIRGFLYAQFQTYNPAMNDKLPRDIAAMLWTFDAAVLRNQGA